MSCPHALRTRRALIALLLLLLPALAAGQTGSMPLLFEVKSASTTVYLFGTIHVGARKLYPLGKAAEEAFARSGMLALEADPTDQAAILTAMSAGLYQPPDSLQKNIDPALYARLEEVLPALGLPIEYARSMKPYLLAMTLAMLEVQRQGYDAALGLDVHFARLAKAQAKRIVQLESMAEQVELFDGLPHEVQEGMVRLVLDSLADGTLAKELEVLVTAWSAGDAGAIHASTRKELEDLPETMADLLYERMYHARNRAMADKVDGFLSGSEICFVAVGAGHLTGETGLPVLLQERGYAVRRM